MEMRTGENNTTIDLTTSPPRTASVRPSHVPIPAGGKSINIFARYFGVGNLSFFCPIEGRDHTYATSPPLYKHLIKIHSNTSFSAPLVIFNFECSKCSKVISGKTQHIISFHFKNFDHPDVTKEVNIISETEQIS